MSDRVLIVDDDHQLATLLERFLRRQGFLTASAGSAGQMALLLDRMPFDLIVLDIGLPDKDGFEIIREIRKSSRVPIIVLTVRGEVIDRIVGLELGADDYLTKPFEPRELLARIRSVMRRVQPIDEVYSNRPPTCRRISFQGFLMDLTIRSLTMESTGETVDLTSTEFNLLKVLVEHPNTAMSRERILDAVYGASQNVTDRVIDAHMVRLRRKMGPGKSGAELIKTIHRNGYLLAAEIRSMP
jgi:DNA-binding response OmpR family regulator